MAIQPTRTVLPMTLPLRFVGGVLLALVGALALVAGLMQPPAEELRLMALFLGVTATLSIFAGYGAYRLGWLRAAPRLSWTLLGSYALSSLLTFVNVWVTARLMFASQHDLLLATVLLIFASGIAMALGLFLASALTSEVAALGQAAQAIAEGQLETRVAVSGRDELAALGQSFNGMAARLEEAARRQREAEQLRRDLIAWVGHDLRTPLASMRAVVEAMADGVVTDEATVHRYLQTARRDIRSLSLLIDDLFELAQLDAGGLPLERQPNALSDLLSDTLESFTALAHERGIMLAGAVAADVDPVTMDVQKIGRVLANLVGNALRHTPPGGDVRVTARRNGPWAIVEVVDTGEGIADSDLPHIFEQFYRGEKSRSRETGGAGLGLAIARRLVEAHGGTIEALSQPGAGCTVRFSLPTLKVSSHA